MKKLCLLAIVASLVAGSASADGFKQMVISPTDTLTNDGYVAVSFELRDAVWEFAAVDSSNATGALGSGLGYFYLPCFIQALGDTGTTTAADSVSVGIDIGDADSTGTWQEIYDENLDTVSLTGIEGKDVMLTKWAPNVRIRLYNRKGSAQKPRLRFSWRTRD